MGLEGQVAVITGGAGGIGSASAAEWIGRGGKVVLADLGSQAGKAAEFLAAHGGASAGVFLPTDTRRDEDLEACAAAAAALGTLTCWFNNAGFAQDGDDIDGLREVVRHPHPASKAGVNLYWYEV